MDENIFQDFVILILTFICDPQLKLALKSLGYADFISCDLSTYISDNVYNQFNVAVQCLSES